MKQLESTFPNMVIVLLIISLISAGVLAATYESTAEDIAAHQLAKQLAAIDAVLPAEGGYAYDNDILEDQTVSQGYQLYPAYIDSKLVGVAVLGIGNNGFGGPMQVMAGFSTRGELINAVVVQHSETPGLGTKVGEEKFAAQFRGIELSPDEVLTVSKDGGTIDAVTAATISSRAYCDAVSLAWKAASAFFGGQQ